MARTIGCFLVGCLAATTALADELEFPPRLPGDQTIVRHSDAAFLEPPVELQPGVQVARQRPTIEFAYYPGQDYPGRPWSNWGDSLFANGRYYSAIGDHLAPQGNAFVYEYDPQARTLKQIVDVRQVIDLPEGHYTPGKIHSRIERCRDGRLYFSTHRGSTRATTDANHYTGDWVLSHDPASGETRIVAQGPVPKHCIPTSRFDPERMIFYGGTAPGDHRESTPTFFALDVSTGKVRHTATPGPKRAMIFSPSTGRVYFMDEEAGRLMRYDPEADQPPVAIDGQIGLRAATEETPQGVVYTVGQSSDPEIERFDVKTEQVTKLGPAKVGSQAYITALHADPTGRYLYYCPGAHGGAYRDGTPIVQFDTKTGTRKVLAFLHPFFEKHYGFVPIGTYGLAVSDDGSQVFITFNGCRGGPDNRGRYPFNTCGLIVLHIPEDERPAD